MTSEIAIASLLLDYINETSHTNNPGPSHVDLWDSFVGKEDMYVRDGLHPIVGRGLPFLPRDCQGRLPVAWVKYVI